MRHWQRVLKFDQRGARIADRHYSRRKVGAPQFMPPGQTIVLLSSDERSVFGWWRPDPDSGIKAMNGLDGWTCMDQAFNELARRHARLPWVHGLRMLGQAGGDWPLASADSTNVAQNWKRDTGCAECKAAPLDAVQTPALWTERPIQKELTL